jgi:segregation and condensation protein B
MAFNLKLVLKALLFSSSQPLTIKDIQTVFARYHDQALTPVVTAEEGESVEGVAPVEDASVEDASVEDSPARVSSHSEETSELAGTTDEVNPLGLTPVDAELYADVPSLVTAAQIREAMDALAEELKAINDIYLLIDGAQGYRLVTHPRFAKWIRIQRDEPPPVKLTQSAIETLAVVAYRQPVTRSEIESIRGVSSENVLGKLMERDLVYVVGRADLPGRPIQYGTTDKFLEFVGVKSLVELPASDVLSPRQIDEWLNRSATVSPLADAEMGLPLEEGEGESPSFEPVEIEHVVESHEEESHDGEEESIEGDAPAGEVGEIVEPSVVEQVESVVDDDDSEKKSEPAA